MLERWLKPRTEHPDPKIRGEALAQLAPDDPLFVEALHKDEDIQVRARLAALATNLPQLLALSASTQHQDIAAAAKTRLHGLLSDPAAMDDAARAAFVGQLDDVALLAHSAANAPTADARRVAIDRHKSVASDHAMLLIQVAGHDDDPALRREAFGQIEDLDALEKVAIATRKSDKHLFKDVREKIRRLRQRDEDAVTAAALVEQIHQLARQPVVAHGDEMHRAIALLQNWQEAWAALRATTEITLPEVADAEATMTGAIEAAREAIARRERLIETLGADPLASVEEPDWQTDWDALKDHTPADQARFDKALAQRRQRLERERQRQGVVAAATQFVEQLATRTNVDERGLQKIAKSWAGFALPADEHAEALQTRYAQLYAALETQLAAVQASEAKAAQGVTDLLSKLDNALSAGQLSAASSAHDKLNHLLRTKNVLAGAALQEAQKRLGVLSPKFRELKEARNWSTRQARDTLLKEAQGLAQAAAGQTPTELARRVKALRAQWQELDKGVGPAEAATWTQFDTACRDAYAPAKAQFNEDAAKRRDLCERLETFAKEADWEAPDWGALVTLLRDTRKAWRESGQIEHRKFLKLRKRFDAAIAPLDARLTEEREQDTRRRKLSIGALRTCIERDPIEAQIALAKQVQRDWKPTVRGRRKEEQALWDELRALCDDVFARRDAKSSDRLEAEDAAAKAKAAACTDIDALLTDPAAATDTAAVNLARGQFDELRQQWLGAGDVGPRKKTAVQSQFRAACERFEKRMKAGERQSKEQQFTQLIERFCVLDEHVQALATGSADAAAKESWDKLPALRGALGKKFDAAFSAPPGETSAAGLAARQDLCLRAELAADLPSPREFEQARMALKISQLKDALAGAGERRPQKLMLQFIEEWLTTGPVEAAAAAGLRERFVQALRALEASR